MFPWKLGAELVDVFCHVTISWKKATRHMLGVRKTWRRCEIRNTGTKRSKLLVTKLGDGGTDEVRDRPGL